MNFVLKKVTDYLDERAHRNFFRRFFELKTVNGLEQFPKIVWGSVTISGKVYKRAYLHVKDLYMKSSEQLSNQLGYWEAEFKTTFTAVETLGGGEYMLWTSCLKQNEIVDTKLLLGEKSEEGKYIFGINDRYKVAKIPLFTGSEGATKIVSLSGHGKTRLVMAIAGEVCRIEKPKVILVTTKHGRLVKRHLDNNRADSVALFDPRKNLIEIRDIVKQEFEKAEQRLTECEKSGEEFDLKTKVLIIIDEALDIFEYHTGKSALEDDKVKEEICEMLGHLARRMRNVGVHIIYCLQRPSLQVVPENLRTNTQNVFAGRIEKANISYVLRSRNDIDVENLKVGQWYFENQTDLLVKVQPVTITLEGEENKEDKK